MSNWKQDLLLEKEIEVELINKYISISSNINSKIPGSAQGK